MSKFKLVGTVLRYGLQEFVNRKKVQNSSVCTKVFESLAGILHVQE